MLSVVINVSELESSPILHMYLVLNKYVTAPILSIFSRHLFRNNSNSASRVVCYIDVI